MMCATASAMRARARVPFWLWPTRPSRSFYTGIIRGQGATILVLVTERFGPPAKAGGARQAFGSSVHLRSDLGRKRPRPVAFGRRTPGSWEPGVLPLTPEPWQTRDCRGFSFHEIVDFLKRVGW